MVVFANILRSIALTEGAFSLGVMVAVYESSARYRVSGRSIRFALVGVALIIIRVMVDQIDNIGQGVGWRVIVSLIANTLLVSSLVALFRQRSDL